MSITLIALSVYLWGVVVFTLAVITKASMHDFIASLLLGVVWPLIVIFLWPITFIRWVHLTREGK